MLREIGDGQGAVQFFGKAYRWEPGDMTSYQVVVSSMPSVAFGGRPGDHVVVSFVNDGLRGRPPAVILSVDEGFAPYVASKLGVDVDSPWVGAAVAALGAWRASMAAAAVPS